MREIYDTESFKTIPWWHALWLRLRYPVKRQIDEGNHMTWIEESITDSKGVRYILSYEGRGKDYR